MREYTKGASVRRQPSPAILPRATAGRAEAQERGELTAELCAVRAAAAGPHMHAVLLWPRGAAREAQLPYNHSTLLQLRRRPQCFAPCSSKRTSSSWPPCTAGLMDKRLATGTVATPLTARVRNDVQTDAHPLMMRTGALSKALWPRPLRQSIAGLRRLGNGAPPPYPPQRLY